jgi:hypothetical protein
VIVNPNTGVVTPFITSLPTGDHPTVVALDNNGGKNQPDIPCQDVTLSQNVFPSSLSPFVATSGAVKVPNLGAR